MLPGSPWTERVSFGSARGQPESWTYRKIGEQIHHPIIQVPHWRYCLAGERGLGDAGSIHRTVGILVRGALGDGVGANPCSLLRGFPEKRARVSGRTEGRCRGAGMRREMGQ